MKVDRRAQRVCRVHPTPPDNKGRLARLTPTRVDVLNLIWKQDKTKTKNLFISVHVLIYLSYPSKLNIRTLLDFRTAIFNTSSQMCIRDSHSAVCEVFSSKLS